MSVSDGPFLAYLIPIGLLAESLILLHERSDELQRLVGAIGDIIWVSGARDALEGPNPVQCSVLLSPEFLLSRQRERYMELTEDAHAQIELAESPEERNRIVERAGAQYECTLKIFKLISGEDLWAEPEAVKGKTQSRKSGNTLHLMESLEPSATSSDTSSVQVSVNSVNRNNRTGRSRSERGE